MEIGSEFSLSLNELKKTNKNIISRYNGTNIEWFDYGRSAIRSVDIDSEKEVLLPEFVCESVINCFDKSRVVFYKVDLLMQIDYDDLISKISEKTGVIYIVHYFGYIHNNEVLDKISAVAGNNNICIIEDITQSLFSNCNFIGDYVVASVRKWLPIPQGGFLMSLKAGIQKRDYIEVSQDNNRANAMILKKLFLEDGFDFNSQYRSIFNTCESKIDKNDRVRYMSDFSKFLLECFDIDALVEKRKINSSYLIKQLKKLNIFPIKAFMNDECPLVVPLRVRNRDDFRKYLIKNKIYCAVHWPFDDFCKDKRENAVFNSETLISLPIDQRYGMEEMDYMLKVIANYGGELIF